MARGFLAGVIWGTVAAGLGVGMLSVVSGLPEPAIPGAVSVTTGTVDEPTEAEAGIGTEVEAEAVAAAEGVAAAEAVAAEAEAPRAAAPEVTSQTQTAMVVPDQVGDASVDPAAPARNAEADPVVERPAGGAPALVRPSRDVDAASSGATPLATPSVGAPPDAPTSAEATPAPVVPTESDTPVSAARPPSVPGPDAPDAAPTADADPLPPARAALPTVPGPQTPPAVAGAKEAPGAQGVLDSAEIEGEPAAEPVLPAPGSEGPRIGQPAVSLLDRDGAVPQGRLPSIGGGAVVAEPAPARVAPRTDGALFANAVDIEVPDDLPRMAVLLIDDGSGPLGPEALAGFPFPVSFAIDTAHPDPKGAAEAYRALGFEVLVIAALPEGAQASDVAVSLEGALATVPQAVAVLESPLHGFEGKREIVTQVAQSLTRTGHGLVMVPRGLNTAAQLAIREGVPSVTLFRDFDSEGQDARMIRRALDQAAFRARQDGAVTMLGRLRADTISALVLWGLQDRSSQLALVPVSTVLREVWPK